MNGCFGSRRPAASILVAAGLLLAAVAPAAHATHIGVTASSSRASQGRARVRAAIAARADRSQAPAAGSAPSGAPIAIAPGSPRLSEPAPAGAGSYWYAGPGGERCIYAPDASPACFVVASPTPAIDVARATATLAAELDLSVAAIDASPAATVDGLTGATSWFWLARAPAAEQLSLALAGETVVVTAQPGPIDWSFGDGASLVGGAGVAFADGPVPPQAITHVYQGRCLPGDADSDPDVGAGCGADGYDVTAQVTWAVSFTAAGPLDEQGALPAQTTEAQLAYPVTEVRAFLTGGGE